MEKQIHKLNRLGVLEALPSFYMVVRTELRTTDEGTARLSHNRPIIHWPSRLVFYDQEEAIEVAKKLAHQTPGFRYTIVGSQGVEIVANEPDADDFEDLL